MNKIFIAGLAGLIAAGSIAAAASPAAAESHWGHGGGNRAYGHGGDRGGYGYRDREGYGAGALIAGGIAGLALGAAFAPRYGYGPGYGECVSRQTVWDPYYGAYVVRPVRYPC